MKKKIKIIISAILLCLALFVCAINIYSTVQRARGNTLPMPLGIGISSPTTGSMEPNIPVGSLVVIVRDSSYEIGDVVAFQRRAGETHTMHRIIEIDGDTVTTCGDANTGSPDDPIKIDQIKGKVVLCIPKVGGVMLKMANVVSHPVTIAVIVIAIVFLMFFPFKSRKDESEQSIDDIKAEIEKLKDHNDPQ